MYKRQVQDRHAAGAGQRHAVGDLAGQFLRKAVDLLAPLQRMRQGLPVQRRFQGCLLYTSTRHADLFSERYACMGRRGHPVLSAGLTPGQFKRLDHILVASRASAHRLLDDVLGEAGLHRQPYLTLPHFSAAAEMCIRDR